MPVPAISPAADVSTIEHMFLSPQAIAESFVLPEALTAWARPATNTLFSLPRSEPRSMLDVKQDGDHGTEFEEVCFL